MKTNDYVRDPRWIKYVDEFNKPKSALLPQDDSVEHWRAIADDNRGHILITGETGVGKDELARILWRYSPRFNRKYHAHKTKAPRSASFTQDDNGDKSRKRSFKEGDRLIRPVNCAGFSDYLITSELFGHVKGAFTGATSDRDGILLSLNGGTVILEELGALSKHDQARILRFIQTGEVQKIGYDETPKVSDVRIIATTNVDPNDDSMFRQDLRNRFTFEINLPPLRDRQQDIPLLISEFMGPSKDYIGIDPSWLLELMSYNWPGNIRELYQYCESARRIARYYSTKVGDDNSPLKIPGKILSKESATDIRIKKASGFRKAIFMGRIPPPKEDQKQITEELKKFPEYNLSEELSFVDMSDDDNPWYLINQNPLKWFENNDIHPAYIAEYILQSYSYVYDKQGNIPPHVANTLHIIAGLRVLFEKESTGQFYLPFRCLGINPKCFDLSALHSANPGKYAEMTLAEVMISIINHRRYICDNIVSVVNDSQSMGDLLSQLFGCEISPESIKKLTETNHSIPGYEPKTAVERGSDVHLKARGRPMDTKNITDERLVGLLQQICEKNIMVTDQLLSMISIPDTNKPAHTTIAGLIKRVQRISNTNPALHSKAHKFLKIILPRLKN